jgi:hypothetical protein
MTIGGVNWIFLGVFVLAVDLIRSLIFDKTTASKRNSLISYPSLIAMLLIPYFIASLYLIIMVELMVVALWVYSIKKYNADKIE